MNEKPKIELENDQSGMKSLGAAMKSIMNNKGLNAQLATIKAGILKDPEIIAFIQAHQPDLTTAIFDRDFATVYEYYTQRNKAQAGQEVVHVGYQAQLVFIEKRIVVSYQASEATTEEFLKHSLITQIGMSKRLAQAKLSDFKQPDQGMAGSVAAVLTFIKNYLATPDEFQRGLYLHGTYGIGKTYLMGAMANQLVRDGISVTMVHYPTLATEIKNSISDKNVNLADRINLLKNAQVLVIDDIGAETDKSGWIRDDVLGVVLDYRMQNELATFFTSNFSMQALEEHFAQTNNGLEPVKAARLMQRIKFLAKEIGGAGQNRRLTD
ncbi:MAG: primosomal protein DnaI [Lactobacillaceae bacterium]|jgi:primosomal protein DnaI|nr:primosomal protein DnaI [Lactobacillaceae bacterium]